MSMRYQLAKVLKENDKMRRERLTQTLAAMGLDPRTRTATFVADNYRPNFQALTESEYHEAYSQESVLEWLMGATKGATHE